MQRQVNALKEKTNVTFFNLCPGFLETLQNLGNTKFMDQSRQGVPSGPMYANGTD